MFVIDVNTTFGKRLDQDPRYSLGTVAAELDRHEVALGLSCSMQGVFYDMRAGNDDSFAAGQRYDQIIPVCTLDIRDAPRWQNELERCATREFRAVRFFPGTQGWTVTSSLFEQLMERLKGSGLCLIFSIEETNQKSWECARDLARTTARSGLPLILTDHSYADLGEIAAVMQEYPHVYAETNLLSSIGAIDVLAEQVGVERLLYGSYAPERPMQRAINAVLEADLPDEAKVAILGGNAMRLLGITPDDLAGRPQLTEMQPKRFLEEIIDVHSHLGYWWCPNRSDEDYDPTKMLQRMKQYGISYSILSSYESMRYDIAAGNRKVAEAIDGHPELLGYVELNPNQVDLSCEEMDRYYKRPNFAGAEIELHHIRADMDGPDTRRLMAEIAKRGKPVLFMPSFRSPAAAEREIAQRHPDLQIIHAHGFDADWTRVVADTPNISVEFNSSKMSHYHIRDALDILGPERVLFGSDQTLLSVGYSIGGYLDAEMTEAERRKVLHENARRLFQIPPLGS